jgi:hypothetical protein
MLRKFAAGLIATALIAGPAFAQTSTPSTNSGSAPAATPAAAPVTQNAPAKAAIAPAKVTTAPVNTMAAPAVTKMKETANPSKMVKHAKLHKKTVRHVASRSHKMHQARHVKSHQVNTGTSAKRS